MRIIHAVPDEKDYERFRQALEDLSNSDEETRRKFWDEIEFFNDGVSAEKAHGDRMPEND